MDDRWRSRGGERNYESNSGEVKDSGKQGDAAHETASNATPREGSEKGVGVEESPASASPFRKVKVLVRF